MLRSSKGQKRIRDLKVFDGEVLKKVCTHCFVLTPTKQKSGTTFEGNCYKCGEITPHHVPTLEDWFEFRQEVDKLIEKNIINTEKISEKTFQLLL